MTISDGLGVILIVGLRRCFIDKFLFERRLAVERVADVVGRFVDIIVHVWRQYKN